MDTDVSPATCPSKEAGAALKGRADPISAPGTLPLASSLPSGLGRLLRLHALGWLAFANGVGVLLAVLLLHPGLNRFLGPLGYGRWVPLHLEGQLYGWCALPLVGLLLAVFLPESSEGRLHGSPASAWRLKELRWVLGGWSLALGLGCLSWLSGNVSGKLFLSWHGWALPLLPLAMLGLWVLLISWEETRLRQDADGVLSGLSTSERFQRCLRWIVLVGLGTVPFALYHAAGRSSFPPVNPDSGGATGGSLLASTLGILVIYGLLPVLLRIPLSQGSADAAAERRGLAKVDASILGAASSGSARSRLVAQGYWGWVLLSGLLFVLFGQGDRSQHEPAQVVLLGLLLPLLPLAWLYFSRYAWPREARQWLLAAFVWWCLLVVTGWLSFLPGLSEHAKFTNALVAHAHVAMAGMVSSAGWAWLVVLTPGATSPRRLEFWLWQLACAVHLAALFALGIGENLDPSGFFLGAAWVKALYSVRLMAGLVMAWLSLRWWWSCWSEAVPASGQSGEASPMSAAVRSARAWSASLGEAASCDSSTPIPALAPSGACAYPPFTMKPEKIGRLLALVAGLLDFSTGLGLVFLPALTLKLMLVAVPGAEALVFVRFVGVFVAAVGASYLWALRRPVERLRVVFGATILFRLGAGSFTLVLVLANGLSPAWLTVTAADFGLVALQSWLLARGVGRDA